MASLTAPRSEVTSSKTPSQGVPAEAEGVPRGTEGVLVLGQYAYVGGFWDTHLAQVDLSGLVTARVAAKGRIDNNSGGSTAAAAAAAMPAMRVAGVWRDAAYVQLVGALIGRETQGEAAYVGAEGVLGAEGGSHFALSLWGEPGGLATFRVSGTPKASAPPLVRELGRLVLPELGRANRVHVHGDLAWLPLEQSPAGGVAAINISDLAQPVLAVGPVALPTTALPTRRDASATARRDEDEEWHDGSMLGGTKSYCVAAFADRVYAFAAPSATLFVYRVG